jgi:2-oxoglutarate ferredoxin oxidoreductase subunit alpha
LVPKAVVSGRGDNKMGFVSIGSCDGAVNEAIDILKRRGVHVDYMRVRGFPFGTEVDAFLAAHETVFVIEQNRDAQLKSLLTLETNVEKAKLRSILHYSGMPMSSDSIVDAMLQILQQINPQAATA